MLHIIENLTTLANNKRIHELVLDRPWHYLKNTAYGSFTNNEQKYESSWQSILFSNNEPTSDLFYLTESLLLAGLYKSNLTCSNLVRIRAGMMTRTPYPVIHDPHIDWESNHLTALYYVNDSDGETIFYDEVWDENLKIPSWEWAKTQNFTIKEKICPTGINLGTKFRLRKSPAEN